MGSGALRVNTSMVNVLAFGFIITKTERKWLTALSSETFVMVRAFWDPDGRILSTQNFYLGKLHGVKKTYHPDGREESVQTFELGNATTPAIIKIFWGLPRTVLGSRSQGGRCSRYGSL